MKRSIPIRSLGMASDGFGVLLQRIPLAARLALCVVAAYVVLGLLWVPGTASALAGLLGQTGALVLLLVGLTLTAVVAHRGALTARVGGFLVVVLLLPVFFVTFAAWKTSIPPFTWDATLARWDRALHGTDPYRLLPSSPALTLALDRIYLSWHVVHMGLVVWQTWSGTAETRARFWLAYVLVWIGLGTGLASLMASAGPVFVPELGMGPFLRGWTHEYLWSAVATGTVVLGGGVSAFPSLHIALPVLGACAAWKVSRWLALGFAAYATIILVSSVALGWHYAIDGYASMLLVPAIWWVTGRLPQSASGR